MTSPRPRTVAALAKRERARAKAEQATQDLHQAIVDDLDDGVTQKVLAELTGYSRERIRLIAKAVRERGESETRDERP
ncbi:MAG: hypothetical protein WBA97_34445 [Actinophytocola sp.]|uniref:hypothetical protein n=1 Tax=Actinophytocola sp. TaxID=1872138 RepID=UPI003C788D7E